jgi:hypothetical protein
MRFIQVARYLFVLTFLLAALALPEAGFASSVKIKSSANNKRGVKPQAPTASRLPRAACKPCAAKTTARASSGVAKPLPCHPKGYVDPRINRNYRAAMRDLKRAGIKPEVTSAWRSSDKQAELYRCSQSRRCRRANPGLYYALPPGRSLHEAGLAVDISGVAAGPRGRKRLTPRGKRIVAAMQKNGFKWRYGLSDPAHFEAEPRKAGYRNLKQAITATQNRCQVRLASASKPPRAVDNKRAVRLQPATGMRKTAALKTVPVRSVTARTRPHNSRA